MATYENYTLDPDQVEFSKHEMDSVCEGIDFELGLDCSGSITDPAELGKLATRFKVGRDFLLVLAEPVMAVDNRIVVWVIKEQAQSPFCRRGSRAGSGSLYQAPEERPECQGIQLDHRR